jgi:hypothetical protein
MRKIQITNFFFLAAILLVACNNVPQTSIQPNLTLVITTSTPSTLIESAYPIDEEYETYVGTIYPLGQKPAETMTAVDLDGPTPAPQKTPVAKSETAAIFGVLHSYSDKLPLQGVMVYAADVVVVEPSGGKVYTTQEKSSPQAATDMIGQFMITGIKPGTYYFMMVTPFGNYPLYDKDNNTFELEFNGGEVINFGDVYVNWP